MTTRQKILMGGLGAITPLVMNLLVVDLSILLVKFTLLVFLGYVIRVTILFYLGGLVAFLHKDERSPIKLFELGIAAPALITAFLNARQVEVSKTTVPTGGEPVASVLFLPSVFAQTTQEQEIKTFFLPEETRTQQFLRGLTGSSPKNVWFVIVGSYRVLENAKRHVQEIEERYGAKGFKAELYAPSGGYPFYAVVIGANLTYEEAQQLRQRAIAAGLPKDAYLWTLPQRLG